MVHETTVTLNQVSSMQMSQGGIDVRVWSDVLHLFDIELCAQAVLIRS